MNAFQTIENVKNVPQRLRNRTGWGVALRVLVLFGVFSCTFSGDLPDLGAEQLRKMISQDRGVVVIDTRSQIEFVRGRIPRAILIEEEKFFALELLLPSAKETPLVFYCRGYG